MRRPEMISLQLILILVMVCFVACNRSQAQTVLLGAETTGEEQQKKEEQAAEPDRSEASENIEEIPVIEVTCNCQCQCGMNGQTVENQGEAATEDASGKVNINSADATQLQTLNGIGESRALDIITYRETYGEFKAIEEIKNVNGIKDGIYNKIKDDITV